MIENTSVRRFPLSRQRGYTGFLPTAILLSLTPGCPPVVVDDNGNDNQPQAASAEIGYMEQGTTNYTRVEDGEVMPLFTSGQGGSHMFVVLRADGFPVDDVGDAEITVRQYITLASDERVLHDFTQQVPFSRIDNGQIAAAERIVIFAARPEEVNGQIVNILFTLTSVEDPTIAATIEQTLLMTLR